MSRQLSMGFSLITTDGVGDDNCLVIFAVRESDYSPSGLEYVTAITDSLAPGAGWFWGHYNNDFEVALADFRQRVSER